MDTFICGACQSSFNNIDLFVQHKQAGCAQTTQEIIQVHLHDTQEVNSADHVIEHDDNTTAATLAYLNEMNVEGRVATVESQDEDGNMQTFIILNEVDANDLNISSPATINTIHLGNATGVESASDALSNSQSLPKKTGRRSGRPRKGEEKSKQIEAVPATVTKQDAPVTDIDGRIRCIRCQRVFNKERHYKTHKCLASSAYVDITKKDIVKIDSGDEEDEDEEAGAIDDDQEEYKAPVDVPPSDDDIEEEDDLKRRGSFKKYQLHTDPDNDGGPHEKQTDSIEDVPIFRSEEEKLEFEANISIDLSCVDHMFKVHVIDQDVNEHAGSHGRSLLASLSLYSCTVCEKVFKTLSHMRLHCLVHTDLKPFKCTKCQYATNSKGNLYTHMRKHTGQFYHCKSCNFRTVNKSHLLEHEATHSKTRHPCALCHKDYSTEKSLVNHVRKYHANSRRGRQYLQSFLQGRQARGSTVIHQCHVCNRKFKKRIDRDRHLFVHDIRDLGTVQKCELCDYTASRRVYLDKHYLKHRVLYCCAACPMKFLSTVRLLDHLAAEHVAPTSDTLAAATCDELFERSINNSLYLPEPDEAVSAEDKQYINLPPELSATNMAMPTVTTDNSAKVHKEKKIGNDGDNVVSVIHSSSTTAETTALQETAISSSHGKGSTNDLTKGNENRIKLQEAGRQGDASAVNMITMSDNEERTEIVSAEQVEKNAEHKEVLVPELVPPLSCASTVSDSQIESGVTDTIRSPVPEMCPVQPSKDSLVFSEDPNTHEVKETVSTSAPYLLALTKAESPMETNIESPLETTTIPLVPNPGTADVADFEDEGAVENEDDSCEIITSTGETGELTEPHLEKEAAEGSSKDQSVVERLGYRPMNMKILLKMRETFGSEECEFCGRLFYTKQDYEPHQRTHTGDKPYRCFYCGFRAITRDNLRRHVEREHENIKFPCKECDFVAPSRTRLWNHQLTHLGINGLECPQCSERFETMKRLRSHLLTQHTDVSKEALEKLTGYKHKMQGKLGKRSYKCPYCERVFIRANSELQKHIWIHEGVKPFKCSLCTYACRSKNNLQAHMLRHSSQKPFSCQECGKAYKSKTALRWHVRSHKDGKLFKCDKCSYEAQQRSHLKRHMETHDVVKRFICQHCDFSANTSGYMKIHYARAHKGMQYLQELQTSSTSDTSNTIVGVEARVFKCISCDYLFGNLSDLKRHLKIRHHVQVQDIAGIEQMQISEVEVLNSSDEIRVTEIREMEPASELISHQQTVSTSEMDEKTASAVNLLQHIIDMQQQGAFGQHEIKVMSEDGQMVAVNPETVIMQQHGHQVLVTNAVEGLEGAGQYVIQYVAPGDDSSCDPSMEGVPMEIQTVDEVV